MSTSDLTSAATGQPSGIKHEIGARLRGPGGLYNLGNLIALGTGLSLQLAESLSQTYGTVGAAIQTNLFGSPGASWLTLAIAIFMISGEVYHRAWKKGAPPDTRLNRIGDLISFFGALALTVSLAMFGDLFLALVSGTLLAGGKLGTAILPEVHGTGAGRNRLQHLFRLSVVVSRAPALAGLAVELGRLLFRPEALEGPAQILAPAVMFVCYLIWARADLLLMSGKD